MASELMPLFLPVQVIRAGPSLPSFARVTATVPHSLEPLPLLVPSSILFSPAFLPSISPPSAPHILQADFSSKDHVETAVIIGLAGEKLEEGRFEAVVQKIADVSSGCDRLVRPTALCTDRSQRWVAYEHMPGGSLRDHLHGEDMGGRMGGGE